MSKAMQTIGFRDFIDPADKGADWILTAIKQHYSHGGAKNLLHGKDVSAIRAYASGRHPMDKFYPMFAGQRRKKGGDLKKLGKQVVDSLRMDVQPLGVLQQPLANALAVLQKMQLNIQFDAVDAVANAERQQDLDRVRNRPLFEQALSSAKTVLGMPLAPAQTEHNAPSVDIESLDLDPSKEDQLNLWANVFYKLRPESTFEVITESLMDWNDFKDKTDLHLRDQVYYGVHACRSYMSDITGLPMYDYEFPGHVYAPDSDLNDGNDQPFRFIEKGFTIEMLLNVMGREEVDVDYVRPMFEAYWKHKGYHKRWDTINKSTETLPLVYMEFKSFDVLTFEKWQNRRGRTYMDIVPFGAGRKTRFRANLQRKWPQQTYFGYWVPGTDHLLKSGKLLGSVRAPGKESLSQFSIRYYRSKEKSDVELCMSVVDDIQRAYLKMQHSIIRSRPKGVYVDFKYFRNAAEQLSTDVEGVTDELAELFGTHNIMYGDTEGFDGQNEGQFLPFREIPGGMGNEVQEYLNVIANGKAIIADLTGYNNALTGQTPDPDALVGLQKLLLNSAQNSLHFARKAVRHTTEKVAHNWAPIIQYICDPKNKETEARKSLENIVGARKIALVNDMDKLPVHQFGLRIEDAPDEDQQAELRQLMLDMVRAQRIELSDFFMARRTMNYKDAQALFVIREMKMREQATKERQEQMKAMTQTQHIKSQEKVGMAQIMAQGETQEEVIKGEVAERITRLRGEIEERLLRIESEYDLAKKEKQNQGKVQGIITKGQVDQQRALPR